MAVLISLQKTLDFQFWVRLRPCLVECIHDSWISELSTSVCFQVSLLLHAIPIQILFNWPLLAYGIGFFYFLIGIGTKAANVQNKSKNLSLTDGMDLNGLLGLF